MKIFLDTNVIIDMMEPKRADAESSCIMFELALKHKIEMIVTTQSLIDSYYIGGHMNVPKPEIDHLVTWIIDHLNVRAIDCYDLMQAINDSSDDVEDNAQVALADGSGCNFFITRDKELLSKNSDAYQYYLSPKQFIERMM